MRVGRLLSVLLVVAVIAASGGQAGAAPQHGGAVTVVHPTGDHLTDVPAVQAAVDGGGSVRLESVNAAGVPTAFNFGPPDAAGVVRLRQDVTIVGDGGLHPTRIVGGVIPFFGVGATHARIEGITFEGPLLSAMIFIRSTGAEIVGNHITGVVGAQLSFPFEATEGRGVKFLGNNDPAGAITGHVLVEGNRFDDMHADLSEAIVFDRVAADVTVVDNIVEDVAGGGVLAFVPGGNVELSRNTIIPGPAAGSDFHVGNGIQVYGSAGGSYQITHNEIRCENPMADPIIVLGQAEIGLGAVEAPVISENDITNDAPEFGAISLFGDVSNAEVTNNRIRGSAFYALGLIPFFGGETADRNLFKGNNLSGFDAVAHTLVLHGTNTVVIGNAGTVFDIGEGTVITGEGPVRGGIARVRKGEDATRVVLAVRGGSTG